MTKYNIGLLQRQKGRLLKGYRVVVRFPSVPPFPEFHNQVVFSASIPGSWYGLVENHAIVRADLFKRGKIVARFNRAWPELYKQGGRSCV